MSKKIFEVKLSALLESASFTEASREELRVLIALMADPTAAEEHISELARTSKARAVAAIALFEEAGILSRSRLVTEEFDERVSHGEIDEESSLKVAKDIRDSGLSSLIAECANIMNKPALSTAEVKKIVALHTQYALGEEFIAAFAAHLADTGRLTTVTRLAGDAIKLVERGIDTPEALYAYIERSKLESDADARLRRLLGIYNRNVTKSEHELFTKWVCEFGYSDEIIGEAYDITVANTNKYSAAYMDRILSRWHECGCKTLAECIERSESDRYTITEEKQRSAAARKPKKKDTGVPKYGAFSAEDALARALERSYGGADSDN